MQSYAAGLKSEAGRETSVTRLTSVVARIQARAGVEHGRAVILTDVVINATEWGKQFVGSPGVYVAESAAEVMSIVESIVAEDITIEVAFPRRPR